jgi:hypothetical protein
MRPESPVGAHFRTPGPDTHAGSETSRLHLPEQHRSPSRGRAAVGCGLEAIMPVHWAERWPGVAHHLLRAGARQGRGTGKSVLRCRSGVGTQQPSARAHACILLASRARWPRWNREAQAAPNLAIVSALIEKTESLPSLDADGRGCRPGRGAEATMPGLRVVVPVPQSTTAADRQVAHAP